METLSLSETAAKIGVTKKCIRYHIGRGALQGQKDAAGEWQIWEASIDAFLEQRNKPGEEGNEPKICALKSGGNVTEEIQGQLVTIIAQYNRSLAEKNDEIKNLYSRIGWLESRLKMLGEAREQLQGEEGEDQIAAGAENDADAMRVENEARSRRLEKRFEELADENKRLRRETRMRRRWGIFYPVAEALGFAE